MKEKLKEFEIPFGAKDDKLCGWEYTIPQEMEATIVDKKIVVKKKELKKIEQKHAWSEKDEENLKWYENFFRAESVIAGGRDIPQDRYLWFKNLKDRVQPQPMQEWNEYDEVGLDNAMWAIKQARSIAKDENDMGNLWYAERWLKSIKDRCTWKPSDEQMKFLWKYAEQNNYDGRILTSLFNDLRKLREV